MKRIIFWASFVIILGLIVWGLAVAMNRPIPGRTLGEPAPVSQTDNVIGSANAPVTLIEYSDYQCPACQQYYPLISKLVEESSTTIRFVYRHFPLDNRLPDGSIQHPNAVPAAMAAEAAGAQGKFWEMSHLIFTNHREWTPLEDAKPIFRKYAATLGLNSVQFEADMASATLRAKITAQKNDGIKIGINGTPSFFVNGKIIDNPNSYEEFKAIIDEAAKTSTP